MSQRRRVVVLSSDSDSVGVSDDEPTPVKVAPSRRRVVVSDSEEDDAAVVSPRRRIVADSDSDDGGGGAGSFAFNVSETSPSESSAPAAPTRRSTRVRRRTAKAIAADSDSDSDHAKPAKIRRVRRLSLPPDEFDEHASGSQADGSASSSSDESGVSAPVIVSDSDVDDSSDAGAGFSHFGLDMKKETDFEDWMSSQRSGGRARGSVLAALGLDVGRHMELDEAFGEYAKFLLIVLLDRGLPGRMRDQPRSAVANAVKHLVARVEEPFVARRTAMVNSGAWRHRALEHLQELPFVDYVPTLTDNPCKVCNRKNPASQFLVLRGQPYAATALWETVGSVEWEKALPDVDMPRKTVSYPSGSTCSVRSNLAHAMVHFKLKLMLELTAFIRAQFHKAPETGRAVAGAPPTVKELESLLDTKHWDGVVLKTLRSYSKLLNGADNIVMQRRLSNTLATSSWLWHDSARLEDVTLYTNAIPVPSPPADSEDSEEEEEGGGGGLPADVDEGPYDRLLL